MIHSKHPLSHWCKQR